MSSDTKSRKKYYFKKILKYNQITDFRNILKLGYFEESVQIAIIWVLNPLVGSNTFYSFVTYLCETKLIFWNTLHQQIDQQNLQLKNMDETKEITNQNTKNIKKILSN